MIQLAIALGVLAAVFAIGYVVRKHLEEDAAKDVEMLDAGIDARLAEELDRIRREPRKSPSKEEVKALLDWIDREATKNGIDD